MGLFSDAASWAKGVFGSAEQAVGGAVTNAENTIGNATKSVANTAGGVFSSAENWLSANVAKPLNSAVQNTVKAVAPAVQNIPQSVGPTLNSIKNNAGGVFSSAENWLKTNIQPNQNPNKGALNFMSVVNNGPIGAITQAWAKSKWGQPALPTPTADETNLSNQINSLKSSNQTVPPQLQQQLQSMQIKRWVNSPVGLPLIMGLSGDIENVKEPPIETPVGNQPVKPTGPTNSMFTNLGENGQSINPQIQSHIDNIQSNPLFSDAEKAAEMNRIQGVLGNKYVGSINTEKLAPEVADQLKALEVTNPGALQKVHMTQQEIMDMAKGMDNTPIAQQILNSPTGQLAAENFKIRSDFNSRILQSIQDKENLASQLDPLMQDLQKQSSDISKLGSESGRTLNMQKVIAAQNEQIGQILDKSIADQTKLGNDEMVGKLQQLKDMYGQMSGQKEFNPSTFDKVYEYWINNILSTPTAPQAHGLGNLSMTVKAPFERFIQSGIELARGGNREVYLGEAPQMIKGYGEGLSEILDDYSNVIKGQSPSGAGLMTNNAFDPSLDRTANTGLLGKIINTPKQFFSHINQFFSTIDANGELRAQAYRQAADEGASDIGARTQELVDNFRSVLQDGTQKGLHNNALVQYIKDNLPDNGLTTDAIDNILKFTKANTFQNEPDRIYGALTAWRRLGDAPDAGPAQKVFGAIGKFVMPIVRQPYLQTQEFLSETPLGLVNLANKDLSATDKTAALAKITLGSLIAGWGLSKVANGEMTGSLPTNTAEADRWRREGIQPYALKFGNQWISYQRLGAPGLYLGSLADAYNAAKGNKSSASIGKIIQSGFAGFVKNITDEPYLAGLSNLIKSAQDPARYGGQQIPTFLNGFVPFSGLTGAIAKQIDPYLKSTDTSVQKIAQNIPGLRNMIPNQRDVFGKPIPIQGSPLTPLKVSTENPDSVDKYLDSIGFVMPVETRSLAQGVNLSNQQMDNFQKMVGPRIKSQVNTLISNPGFTSLPQEIQGNVIKKLYGDVQTQVKIQYLPQVLRSTLNIPKQYSDLQIYGAYQAALKMPNKKQFIDGSSTMRRRTILKLLGQ